MLNKPEKSFFQSIKMCFSMIDQLLMPHITVLGMFKKRLNFYIARQPAQRVRCGF